MLIAIATMPDDDSRRLIANITRLALEEIGLTVRSDAELEALTISRVLQAS